MTQMLALGFDCWVEQHCYIWKTLLVVGGTRAQVLADSMTIAARALNFIWPIVKSYTLYYRLSSWSGYNTFKTDCSSQYMYASDIRPQLTQLKYPPDEQSQFIAIVGCTFISALVRNTTKPMAQHYACSK